MEQGEAFSFVRQPEGEPAWWRTQTYSIINCEVTPITLTKDCLDCPTNAPWGQLTNDSTAENFTDRHRTIVWEKPSLTPDERCRLKKVQQGIGTIIVDNDKTWKIVDVDAQLEFPIQKTTTELCNRQVHKLTTMADAYIVIDNTTELVKGPISNIMVNRGSKLCVNENSIMTIKKCSRYNRQQIVELIGNIEYGYQIQQLKCLLELSIRVS